MSDPGPPRPRAALRARVAVAGGLASLVVALAGFVIRGNSLYPWKAVGVFVGGMVVVSAFLDQHPFERFGLANRVTMIRLMLVALIAALIGEPTIPRAAGAAVVATIAVACLDGLDGWLSRRARMASAFGARFDMETDALLILVLSLLVWRHGKAGAWVLAGGLMRYAFIAAGRLLPWMAGPLSPTRRGKTVAVVQMVGLAVALAPIVPPPLSAIAAAVSLALLTWSFAIDVRRLWRNQAGPAAP